MDNEYKEWRKNNPYPLYSKAQIASNRPRRHVIKSGFAHIVDGLIAVLSLGYYEGNLWEKLADEYLAGKYNI